jgi:hypothetical protein
MTLGKVTSALAAAAFATLPVMGVARAQNESQNQPQSPSSLADAYRGMFVCEQQRGGVDILHVPLDIVLRGNEIQFARPLFNLRGTRVLGSELGNGSVDASGKIHVTSNWEYGGITVDGDYSGTLTPNAGTLTGTQSWRDPSGQARSRTCQAALVPMPNAHSVATK